MSKSNPVESTPAQEPSLADVLKLVATALQQGAANSAQQLAGLQQLLQTQQDREKSRTDREDLDTAEARKSGRHVGATGAYENNFPPAISALNPLGDRDHPRPDLKCDIIWVGYKMPKEALSRTEIELLNALEPGEYRVTKADGKRIPFTVQGKVGFDGRLERLTIHFPCKNTEDRQNHLSMSAYLLEVLGRTQPSVEQLLNQVKALQAELATKEA